jgi:hypothetical protein
MDEEENDVPTAYVTPPGGVNPGGIQVRESEGGGDPTKRPDYTGQARDAQTASGGGVTTDYRGRGEYRAGDPRPQASDFNQGSSRQNRRAYERALNEWEQAQLAGLESDMPSVDDLSYNPAEEQGDFFLGQSAEGQAYADMGAMMAQKNALKQLEGIYSQGGYTDMEREQINQAMQQARAQERAQSMAVQQQMASRGMAGSGSQMAAQMAAQQGAMNRGRLASAEMVAQGQMRALRALEGAADVASDFRRQSFDEASGRGSAIDDFTKDDVGYQRDREMRRADRETEGRRFGAGAAQQNFENLRDVRGDMVGQSQTGRGLLTDVEARQDQDRANKMKVAGDSIKGVAEAGAKAVTGGAA